MVFAIPAGLRWAGAVLVAGRHGTAVGPRLGPNGKPSLLAEQLEQPQPQLAGVHTERGEQLHKARLGTEYKRQQEMHRVDLLGPEPLSLGHGQAHGLNLRYAWPSGDWGSLPIEGGIEAAYRRELEAADDPVALRAEIEQRLNAVRSPFRTAERFGVEEIIDPRDTRPLLCDWAERAHELVRYDLHAGPKRRGVRP